VLSLPRFCGHLGLGKM